jgi:hypothetical protein
MSEVIKAIAVQFNSENIKSGFVQDLRIIQLLSEAGFSCGFVADVRKVAESL